MPSVVAARQQFSRKRLGDVASALADADGEFGSCCCVYATGSYGRGEATRFSDLDLFILGLTKPKEPVSDQQPPEPLLSRLDQICLKRDLIRATRELGLPEFSGDGEYLQHYTVHQLTTAIGARDDDSANTFTARLLLLLESRPVLGGAVHTQSVADVIDAYYLDYDDHADRFEPVFLINDILRLWRTFCVNYEHRTRPSRPRTARAEEDPERKAKRKNKHYKLTHSRMMTCYSAVASLLDVFERQKTVKKEDVEAMAKDSPLHRLAGLRLARPAVEPQVQAVLDHYQRFLDHSHKSETELVALFQESDYARARLEEARLFGQLMFKLLAAVDGRGRLFQTLVV